MKSEINIPKYILLLIALIVWSCTTDPMDEKEIEESKSEFKFSCDIGVDSTCQLLNSWIRVNSDIFPLNYNPNANNFNSISFRSDGNVSYGRSQSGKFSINSNCTEITIRSLGNDKLDVVEIIGLTDSTLILKSNFLCGSENCLMVKNTAKYEDYLDSLIYTTYNCDSDYFDSQCNCDDFTYGLNCKGTYQFIDIPEHIQYINSVQVSSNLVVILDKSRAIAVNKNMEIQWVTDLPIDLNFFESEDLSVSDEEGNIFVLNIKGNSYHLLKINIDGAIEFNKEFALDNRIASYISNLTYKDGILYIYSGDYDFEILKFSGEGDLIQRKYHDNDFLTSKYIAVGQEEIKIFHKDFKDEFLKVDKDLNIIGKFTIDDYSTLTSQKIANEITGISTLSNDQFLLKISIAPYSDDKVVYAFNKNGLILDDTEVAQLILSKSAPTNSIKLKQIDENTLGYLMYENGAGHFELLYKNNVGDFVSGNRIFIELNSQAFDNFQAVDFFMLDGNLLVIGTGKRFTNTIIAIDIQPYLDYPRLECQ